MREKVIKSIIDNTNVWKSLVSITWLHIFIGNWKSTFFN